MNYKKTILLLFSFFVVFNYVYAQRVVRVGAFNFHPAIFKDSDGEVKGFYVDAFQEIETIENIQFVYVFGSWAEGLERIKNGEIDIMVSVAYNDERAKYMDYSSLPLLTVWGEVYTEKSSEIKGLLDLEGKTIAIMKADNNGKQFQILTEKLSIKCTYIEKTDFEQVFQLIASGEVDAGVVNNTFGTGKYQEYELRSSGIIFNPFDIFLTVGKNKNTDLLKLLDEYLHKWMHDANSIYNVSRQKWSHGKIGMIKYFPKWVYVVIYPSIGVLLILFIFILMLRYRVRIATSKIKKSEERFDLAMEASKDGIYDWNLLTNEIYYSPSWKRMLGYKDDELPNDFTIWEKLTEPADVKRSWEMQQKVINKELERFELEFKMKHKDGSWVDILSRAEAVFDENGKAVRIVGTHVDVTQRKEAEKNLVKALEKATESDRLKSAFLATMSHELRTPLNAIIGFSDIINGVSDITEIKKYNNTVNKSGNHLLSIVEDLFDITLIESGQTKIVINKENLANLLNDVYEITNNEKISLGKHNLALELIIPDACDKMTIHTDGSKLKQILINLLKNAVKFTSEGYIRFGYECEIIMDESYLKFFVEDTGIGIAKDKQVIIFEAFRQAEESYTKKYGGTGIGLSIAKKLTELLGGKIWVESEEEKGSKFCFILPLPIHKSDGCNERIGAIITKNLNFKTILIAEDDESSYEYLSTVLKDFTEEILWAKNGEQAVKICKENPSIDLILMDVNMPIMNGYEATKAIKKFRPNLPIIAQTAYAISGDMEKAIENGCDDYISKPIKKEELFMLLKKYLKKRS